MAHVLAANTVAVEPVSGAVKAFLAGDEPPEWAYGQITSAELWEGGVVPEPVEHAPSAPADGSPPPRGGAGSGLGPWQQYAAAKGVTVQPEATREDIIAACEAAGVPTA